MFELILTLILLSWLFVELVKFFIKENIKKLDECEKKEEKSFFDRF
jgi:hypothetical protein